MQEDGLHLQEVEGRRQVLAEQRLDTGLGAEHQVVEAPKEDRRHMSLAIAKTAPALPLLGRA